MKIKRVNQLLALIIITFVLLAFKVPYTANAADNLTSYNITVNFNESEKTLDAVENVKFINTYDSDLNSLVLHLYPDSYNSADTLPAIGSVQGEFGEAQRGDITIKSVLVSGKEVSFTQENQILNIKLDSPLKKGESIEFSINFTLKIPEGTNRLGYMDNQYSLTNWYPIMSIFDSPSGKWDENKFNPIGESNYSDVANYDVTLSLPKGMVVASTGVSSNPKIEGSLETMNIKAENVRDFVMMMSKNYKVVSDTVDGIKINSYYLYNNPKEDNSSVAKNMLSNTKQAIEFFNKTFGKYPYPELDVVETYLTGGAMEYPQLIQMGKYFSANTGTAAYNPNTWAEQAVVHETGHQWWYVTVGNNEFMEPVLDESLTTYSTAYFYEKKYGRFNDNSVTLSIRGRLYPGLSSSAINSSVDKFSNWIDYNSTIYIKGPIVFEDLRNQIGDEKFQKLMQTYFERYKFKNSSVEDFLKVVEEVAGENVKNNIQNALNSKDYYPKQLELSDKERMEYTRYNQINELKDAEKANGIMTGSMISRAINKEKIYIVKPAKMTSSEQQNIENQIKNIISTLKTYFDITPNIVVVYDTKITQKELKENNIILLGNPSNNKIIKQLNSKMPVVINSKDITVNTITIRDKKNVTGLFAIKNPLNSKKVMLEIFWTNNFKTFDLLGQDIYYNLIIDLNGKSQIRNQPVYQD